MALDLTPETNSEFLPAAGTCPSTEVPSEERARQQLEKLCLSLRHEQNELTKAEQIGRAKELYEIAFPGARRGGAPGKKGGGKEASTVASFATYMRKETMLSERNIRNYVAIAAKIGPSLRDQIRGTEVAHEKELLRKLSTFPEDRQMSLWAQFKPDGGLQALKKACSARASAPAHQDDAPAEMILQVGDHVSVRRGPRVLPFAIFAVMEGQVHIRPVEGKVAKEGAPEESVPPVQPDVVTMDRPLTATAEVAEDRPPTATPEVTDEPELAMMPASDPTGESTGATGSAEVLENQEPPDAGSTTKASGGGPAGPDEGLNPAQVCSEETRGGVRLSLFSVNHDLLRAKGRPLPGGVKVAVQKVLLSTRDVTVVGPVNELGGEGGVLSPDVRRLLADRFAGPSKTMKSALEKDGFRLLRHEVWSSTYVDPNAEVILAYAQPGRRTVHQFAVALSGPGGELPDRVFAFEPTVGTMLLRLPTFSRWRLSRAREEAVLWVALWAPRGSVAASSEG
ncbi:MAG TPA: hypothetical protein VFS43_20650 [Polyangiaceae bacterium]|nr:hypothetical protein [Polyangiaceae bacterium]